MIARTPQNQKKSLLSAIALLALASTVSVLGCKSNQPETAAQPVSAAPSEPPKRQPVTTPPAVKKHLYSAPADPKERELLATLQAELVQVQSQPPWTVLGISQGADDAAARSAFFAASKRYHPHAFARYAMPEIKAVVTQLFIVYKRAFTTMTKTGRGGRNAKPAAGSGNPPQRFLIFGSCMKTQPPSLRCLS